ncbi:LRR receptor-like serine/threonine-protein kinase GSO2 [Iris pallida]|uniref:LRR receptor-like serine/threonine-protein kinase GSO2 n=1 Tax=Iris pallida TaxID=29817 RepID=A0AAX6II97_IRIPA|nr:LRR receptor-like serine/threonine-protein kinase GSO2 [Iris pallida]
MELSPPWTRRAASAPRGPSGATPATSKGSRATSTERGQHIAAREGPRRHDFAVGVRDQAAVGALPHYDALGREVPRELACLTGLLDSTSTSTTSPGPYRRRLAPWPASKSCSFAIINSQGAYPPSWVC